MRDLKKTKSGWFRLQTNDINEFSTFMNITPKWMQNVHIKLHIIMHYRYILMLTRRQPV